jgi:hypothetical protein
VGWRGNVDAEKDSESATERSSEDVVGRAGKKVFIHFLFPFNDLLENLF